MAGNRFERLETATRVQINGPGERVVISDALIIGRGENLLDIQEQSGQVWTVDMDFASQVAPVPGQSDKVVLTLSDHPYQGPVIRMRGAS